MGIIWKKWKIQKMFLLFYFYWLLARIVSFDSASFSIVFTSCYGLSPCGHKFLQKTLVEVASQSSVLFSMDRYCKRKEIWGGHSFQKAFTAKATRKEINLLVAFKSLHEKAPTEINWKLKLLRKNGEVPLGHYEISWHKDKCFIYYAAIVTNLVYE